MDARRAVRRLVLVGSGLLFPAVAILSLVAPHAVAAQYAVTLDSVDASNQFRAVYFGFWIGLGVLMITAAVRDDLPVLGRLAAVLLLSQAAGRALSLVLDGLPSGRFAGAMVLEAVAGIALMAVLPRPSSAAPPGGVEPEQSRARGGGA